MSIEKIYTCVTEIEKEFFPSLYKDRLQKQWDNETPEETGARIVSELFEAISQRLTK